MLSNYPIDVVLLAMDLAAAKAFYADKIGLPVLNETPGGVTFQCGGDSQLVVTKSSVGTRDEQTQASFRVADVRAEVSELRRRGVQIEDYDLPGLKTDGCSRCMSRCGCAYLSALQNSRQSACTTPGVLRSQWSFSTH